MPILRRILLTACLLAPCAPLALAQAPAAAPPGTVPAAAPTAPEPAAAEGSAAPEGGAAAPASGAEAAPGSTQDGTVGSGNLRRLKAGGEEFGVRVAPITGGPAQGALVLIPGDGAFPMRSRGIAQLLAGMPAFGWSVWLPELPSPPRIYAAALEEKQAKAATQPAPPSAAASAEPPAAEPPTQNGADDTAAAERVPLEAARAGELQDWAARSRARLAAVVDAAAREGRVVVVAEGVAAALLTGLVAEAPHAAFAVALIEPVELPGLPAAWPAGSATPVLEVFDPSVQPSQGAARRARANASGLHYYRQTVLSTDAGSAPDAETLLVRRLRGWVKSLAPADAPPAAH